MVEVESAHDGSGKGDGRWRSVAKGGCRGDEKGGEDG